MYETRNNNLKYGKNAGSDNFDCFMNSDFAGDNVDRKSTGSYVVKINRNVIFWKSKKQSVVAKCSIFGEYIALRDAVAKVLFIRNLCNKMFGINIKKPVKIYEDNSGAEAIAKFGNFTKNSKHIEVQYHFINKNYEGRITDIVEVESSHNSADILTIALSKNKFLINKKKLKLE